MGRQSCHSEQVTAILPTQTWVCCTVTVSLKPLTEAFDLNPKRGQLVFKKTARPEVWGEGTVGLSNQSLNVRFWIWGIISHLWTGCFCCVINPGPALAIGCDFSQAACSWKPDSLHVQSGSKKSPGTSSRKCALSLAFSIWSDRVLLSDATAPCLVFLWYACKRSVLYDAVNFTQQVL